VLPECALCGELNPSALRRRAGGFVCANCEAHERGRPKARCARCGLTASFESHHVEGRRNSPSTAPLAPAPPRVSSPLDMEKKLSPGRLNEFNTAMCECMVALFLLVVFFVTCGREVNAAIRATIRRATPQTADHVFEGVLREKIENRLNRREADKLRKRRTRQLAVVLAT
jgi:hypothetical protein